MRIGLLGSIRNRSTNRHSITSLGRSSDPNLERNRAAISGDPRADRYARKKARIEALPRSWLSRSGSRQARQGWPIRMCPIQMLIDKSWQQCKATPGTSLLRDPEFGGSLPNSLEMRSISFYHFFPLALPLLLPDEDLSLASLESFAFRGSSMRKPTKFFCPNVFK
jgi:hypothetical protein